MKIWIVYTALGDGNTIIIDVFSSSEEARKCRDFHEERDSYDALYYAVLEKEVKDTFEPL